MRHLAILLAIVGPLSLCVARDASAEEATTRAEQFARARALLEQEPPVAEVRHVALRYLNVHPEVIDSLRRRGRAKAALPYVRMGAQLNGFRASRTLRDQGPVASQVDSDDQFLSLRNRNNLMLAYDLPGSVFNTSQLQLYQESYMAITVFQTINTMYFHRRQLILYLMVDPPQDPRAYDALRIRIQGYTSLLNTFTGGWFSRQLPEGSI